MKKALTYTVVSGSMACPNDCPICISKMTPGYGIGTKEPYVNWAQFDKATQIAVNYNARYFLLTSKGEATLFPAQVTEFLHRVEGRPFDRRELQTEGSTIARGGRLYDEFLRIWKDHGLDLVAVSIYHHDNQKNHDLFRPKHQEPYNLQELIEQIHSHGLRVRLSCVMLKGYVDSVEGVSRLIEFSKQNGIFQLTLRRADRPADPLDERVAQYVDENRVDNSAFNTNLANFLEENGTLCDILPHGALIYEVNGQNVGVTTGLSTKFGGAKTREAAESCLKNKPSDEDLRQLIFIPPDMLTTSWENIFGGRIL